jgi:Heparan-alpha-glucosaminide N-acetyltransferase, catalytic
MAKQQVQSASRLAYIDWMRGLACVVMFQTHCYDAWLKPEARQTAFYRWSRIGGTLPAPLFLFLAGISFALVTDKLLKKGTPPGQVARKTILRGAEIFGLGLLLRLQEFLISLGWSPWSDLFRVDILNTIGVSMMLMGVFVFLIESTPFRSRSLAQDANGDSRGWILPLASAAAAGAISMLTPLLWTTWRMPWLPWPIESYINGVHNLGEPQAWLFPIFPWSAFAFAGLAAGFLIFSDWAKARGAVIFMLLGVSGIAMIYLSRWLDALPRQLYPVYDYWHTSPNFLMLRLGLLLIILLVVYTWCRWGFGQRGFSPLVQLGQTSLLVYWVHIGFVYGRLSILGHRKSSIFEATLGLLIICVAMLALSIGRTRWKQRRHQVPNRGIADSSSALRAFSE